jgi:cation:H+ antiporter
MAVAALIAGVALLAWASDQFVVGAARIAAIRRVAPLLVGVVVIGFGTSAPEMVVSALAAARGEPEVAVGNVIGSNLANLGLILGVGVVIYPLAVASGTVRREAPLALGATIAFALLVQGGVGRLEGAALLTGMALTLMLLIRRRPHDPLADDAAAVVGGGGRFGLEVLRTGAGLAGTLAGSQLLLWGALELAADAGLDAGFVGATVVALGTSLPELVTVVQSARRRQGDLVLGNLLGSNIFNALAVGGLTGLLGGVGLTAPALTGPAAVAMVAQVAIVWWMMRTGRRISRAEGVVLLLSYGALIPFLGVR